MATTVRHPMRSVAAASPAREITDLIGERESWQALGLCREVDPELFFPEKGCNTVDDARRICGGCDVRQECLSYALDNNERFGVWGGMTERERKKLQRLLPVTVSKLSAVHIVVGRLTSKGASSAQIAAIIHLSERQVQRIRSELAKAEAAA